MSTHDLIIFISFYGMYDSIFNVLNDTNMMRFSHPAFIKIDNISCLWSITSCFLILLLMDKPLPSCLAGGCLWYDIALDKTTFICTPRNKRMAPGHSVRACIHSILCMIACPFVITYFLYCDRNNTCPGTRCVICIIHCGCKTRQQSDDDSEERYNHNNWD